jgi:Mn2+/Fe2+ NRAMP family transporter
MVPLTGLSRGDTSPAEQASARDASAASARAPETTANASGSTTPIPATQPEGPPSGGASPVRAIRGRRSRLLVFLSLLGPGIVATAAGNDAGGILTYIQAGAQFKFSFLWAIVLVTFAYYVVQEMCARMGAVTGKGLADLIRENYGVKITAFAMVVQLIANLATTVTEFAGVSAACRVFGMPDLAVRYVAMPVTMFVLFFLIAGNSYARVERIFLLMSALLLAYVVAAIELRPDWFVVANSVVHPDIIGQIKSSGASYITMLIALIGTTIAPYQQFYLQSAIRDKGIGMKSYGTTRFDVLFGCVTSNLISIFIVVACAVTLFTTGHRGITDVEQASQVLNPLVGPFIARVLFGVGLLGASILAAVIVPLTTAYAVTESLGWETGVGRRVRESPIFYGTYAAMVAFGGILLMIPNWNLVGLIIQAQVLNGVLLPVELFLMILLCSKKWLMGKYRNSTVFNAVAWATISIVVVLAVTDVILTFSGAL